MPDGGGSLPAFSTIQSPRLGAAACQRTKYSPTSARYRACRIRVGDEVCEAFVARDAGAARAFKPHAPGKWLADLFELARGALTRCGVTQIFGGDLVHIPMPSASTRTGATRLPDAWLPDLAGKLISALLSTRRGYPSRFAVKRSIALSHESLVIQRAIIRRFAARRYGCLRLENRCMSTLSWIVGHAAGRRPFCRHRIVVRDAAQCSASAGLISYAVGALLGAVFIEVLPMRSAREQHPDDGRDDTGRDPAFFRARKACPVAALPRGTVRGARPRRDHA